VDLVEGLVPDISQFEKIPGKNKQKKKLVVRELEKTFFSACKSKELMSGTSPSTRSTLSTCMLGISVAKLFCCDVYHMWRLPQQKVREGNQTHRPSNFRFL